MLHAGHPGFVHAPVTKAIIALVVLATVFGSILGSQTRLTLNLSDAIHNLHLWRLFTHNFVFTTPGELIFGIVLLYYFRQFERQMGSSRFAAFALITATLCTVFLSLFQLVFPTGVPAPGPYALIFASLVHFFFETPKIYHFHLFGALHLSDKSFAYLLALQLIASRPPRSLLSTFIALLSGILYRLPPLRERDLPDFLITFCSTYVLPFLGTNPRPSRFRPRRHHHRHHHHHHHHNRGASPPAQPIAEANVDTLVAMGFSREQSIAALHQNQDDIQRATDQLLALAN